MRKKGTMESQYTVTSWADTSKWAISHFLLIFLLPLVNGTVFASDPPGCATEHMYTHISSTYTETWSLFQQSILRTFFITFTSDKATGIKRAGKGYQLPHTASTAAAKRVNETVKTRSSTLGYKAAPTFPLGWHGLPFALVGSVPQAGGHILAANCLRPCTGTSTSWCCLCWLPLVLGQLLLQRQGHSWVILLKTGSEGNTSVFAQIYGEVKLF